MSGHQEVTYTLDFEVRRRSGPKNKSRASPAKAVPFRASPG